VTREWLSGEGVDVVFGAPGELTVIQNDLYDETGVANLGTGAVDATLNCGSAHAALASAAAARPRGMCKWHHGSNDPTWTTGAIIDHAGSRP